MADDIQSKQLLMSLNQLKKVSDKTLLAEFDKDAFSEAQLIEKELRRLFHHAGISNAKSGLLSEEVGPDSGTPPAAREPTPAPRE